MLHAQTFAISSGEDSICYISNERLQLSDLFAIEGNETDVIEGLQISLASEYDGTDRFIYEGNDPAIEANFDSSVGTLELLGDAAISQYRNALDQTFFETDSPEKAKSINVTISGVDFLVSTGHFYQFFSSPGITWEEARDEASQKRLYDLEGYLTTITTTAENQFILNRVSGTAWIGASDVQEEGIWRWITGPEATENSGLGRLLASGFQNWESGEPNNLGPEHYAHMMDWSQPPGQWNDLANEGGAGDYEPTGYIVEYGGLPGEPNVLETLSQTIVLESEKTVEMDGPLSICPNLEGVIYQATDLVDHTYQWTVEGGTIASGQGTSSISVNWGDTNPNASVKVLIESEIACSYEIELNVKINEQLEPPLPEGPSLVCFVELEETQTYSTPQTIGSVYNWQIQNGQIVSGNGTNTIEVLWDGPGFGELFFTESTTTATDICDGDSPILQVEIKPEIEPIVSITDVSCNGFLDGGARIESVNGSDQFQVRWNTFGRGSPSAKSITDLPAGTYSAEVSFEGCTINLPIIIEEPEPLSASINSRDALCFGQANGSAEIVPTGGTAPYRFEWSHNDGLSAEIAQDLPAGNHEVQVIDANNCNFLIEFTIEEPLPLTIDSIATRPTSCPELSDGRLEAFISGGTPPYSYTWVESGETSALLSGLDKGTYQLEVTDANGCNISGSQFVDESIPKIVLPNAFSPNGDGENDTFRPATNCPVQFVMKIYNRWGAVIFETTDINIGWDGRFNGSYVSEGKYSYFASWLIEANGIRMAEQKRGEFKLIR